MEEGETNRLGGRGRNVKRNENRKGNWRGHCSGISRAQETPGMLVEVLESLLELGCCFAAPAPKGASLVWMHCARIYIAVIIYFDLRSFSCDNLKRYDTM